MNSKNIAIGLAAIVLSIASTPAAYAISLITVMPAQRLDADGNNLFATRATGIVDRYNGATGALVTPAFAPGGFNYGLAVSGNYLYVSEYYQDRISKYDIITGAATVNFISGLNGVFPIEIDGNNLYTTADGNKVLKYNATTGAVINSSFISGFSGSPEALAIDGNKLFVAIRSTGPNNGKVAIYDKTTGAVINSSLVSGLRTPQGLAISGNSLFVSDVIRNIVTEYDATTGAVINSSLVSGLTSPVGLAISNNTLYIGATTAQAYSIPVASTSVPEPFTIIGTIVGGTAALRMRKKLKSATINSASDDV